MKDVINCKKCFRLFKKTTSELCPECFRLETDAIHKVFSVLQDSFEVGGIAIHVLAEQTTIDEEEILTWYYENKLGTAGMALLFECHACKELIKDSQRRGRYCINCSTEFSERAGVEVKSQQQIDRELSEEAKLKAQLEMLHLSPKTDNDTSYGMKRR